MGYKSVVSVPTLDEAYDLLCNCGEQFPVLFLDYHFPNGRTGAELLERLKAKNLLDGRVTFFITAEPAVQKAIEANMNGLAGVVSKPFNVDRLNTLISRVDRDLQMERESQE
jgi:DNA-binding NtrC family response regulator